jgi:Ca2+-binding RTX toxin-like protein
VDTLSISSAANLSSAILTNFESMELNANNTTVNAASISGQTLDILSTGGEAVLSLGNIQSTLNLENLSFLDANVSIATNFETSKHNDLVSNSNVVVSGSSVNDVITGHAGNDNLTGGAGADTITGGAGEDTIILTETSSAADVVVINAVVGTSEDSGRKTISGNANDTGDDTITGFAVGTDTVKISASSVASFLHGTDTTIGTAGAANDGTAGSFASTVGLVELNQTTNNDWDDAGDIALTFSSVTGTFNEANFEAALQYDLTLTNAGVTATTGVKDDTVTGGTGADTITGGAGADTITGDAGADVFLIAAAADHATGETIVGGADADTIRFTSTTASETLALLAGVTDADNAITVEISDAAGANTGTTALNVNADALVDTLVVTLIGNDGDNVLVGNATADTINGGAGADTITGGAGADVIQADAGDDTINGGAGADKIRFSDTNGTDAVTFVRNEDSYDFSQVTANGTIAEAAITNDAGTALGVTTLGANTTIYVFDTDATELGTATAAAIADFTDMSVVATFLNTADGVTTGNNSGKVNYFLINDGDVDTAAYIYKHTDNGDGTTSVQDAELALIAISTHDAGAIDVNDVIIA